MRFKVMLASVFICVSAAVAHAAVLLDRVVAIVNQEVVTWSELYRDMEADASPKVREMNDSDRLKTLKAGESSFLETVINFKLQIQEAKNLGIGVGDDEIRDAIDGIKKKYSMSDSTFNDSLKKEGFTLEEYKRRLREQILVGKVVNSQVRGKILVTDAEVKKFIGENKAYAADSEEGYRISQIFFRKPKNDEEKRKTEDRAAEVLKKIKEGENFQELAKTYSEDASASVGGDLGFIKKGQLMKEFSEAVAKLKAGEVSEPFWSGRGLHIILLNEKTGPKSEHEMMDEARKKLSQKMFEERYASWIKSLREKAFVDIKL